MLRTSAVVLAVLLSGLATGGNAVAVNQPRDVDAAVSAAQRKANCFGCDFYVHGRSKESARRGLLAVGVEAPEGGGYVMLMAYTGSRWARLWEGNGSTQNMETLPAKTVICMDDGGWTNIRKGPGLNYGRVGKVTRPTVKKVFEARLTKPLGHTDGEAWFRISYNGRPAWVQNLRTIVFGPYGHTASQSCELWHEYYS